MIKLKYIAICSAKSSPGVLKKINGFVAGASKENILSSSELIEPRGYLGYFCFFKEIIGSNENIIVIRYLPKAGVVIFLLGILLRLRRQRLIIDVPTPIVNLVNEIRSHQKKKVLKVIQLTQIYLQGSLPFLTSSKVLQYAEESSYFSFGIKNRVMLIGNGVDVDSIKCRSDTSPWPAKELNLIAVGTIACWHGWDRIIRLLNQIKEDALCNFKIKFTIVGDGPELKKLQELVSSLKMNDEIIFKGYLVGNDLDYEYSKAHLAIGSFGWDRVGITTASPLKSREYLAAGLPFVYSTKDIDFDKANIFALYMDSIKDLKEFLIKAESYNFPSPRECRQFAEDRLDFSKKIKSILMESER
jgi:glycosyltransferase involved in cell wall biosynthesis